MRDIRVHRVTPDEERRTYASAPPDGAMILDGDVRLLDADTGATVGLQVDSRLVWANDITRSLARIKWFGGNEDKGSEFRLSGFKNAHRTFGHSAPVPLRRRYGCSVCVFNDEYPRLTTLLARFMRRAADLFEEHAPKEYHDHLDIVQALDPSWLFGEAPWTSGIINRTSALPYHRDAGNLKGSWSAMLALRRDVSGGLLHLADYDVYLTIPHRSVTLFDGQGVLHAVTPFHVQNPKAYRYTIVTYAKAGMRKCLAGEAEVRRAQRERTLGEDRVGQEIANRAR